MNHINEQEIPSITLGSRRSLLLRCAIVSLPNYVVTLNSFLEKNIANWILFGGLVGIPWL